MRSLIKYSLHDYVRSHKYFPPVATFIILIFIFYTYKPNPIIDSYAITAIMVYIISAWLCLSALSIDSSAERDIMALHTGGWNRYYCSKLISVLIISIVLTTYAFLYPIIFNMFGERVTMTIGIVSFGNHILLGLLGISTASLFSRVIMQSSINSFGGLTLTIVISIASLGIKQLLPSLFQSVVWLIPPATITQVPLFNWNGVSIFNLPFFPFIWTIIYSFILVSLFLGLAKRLR